MHLRYTLILFSFAFLLLSCSQKPNNEKSIIGKWKQSETGSIYEFSANGDVRVDESYGVVNGNYLFTDNHKINITFKGNDIIGQKVPIVQADVIIKDDTLTLKYMESVVPIELKFERVK